MTQRHDTHQPYCLVLNRLRCEATWKCLGNVCYSLLVELVPLPHPLSLFTNMSSVSKRLFSNKNREIARYF